MLTIRDRLKNIYAEYNRYILAVVKYALALFTFLMINSMLGYMDLLNNIVVVLVLSAVCAILPWNAIPILGVCMIILHCFSLGLEVGACAVVLYLILLIFYFRFVPGDGLALTLTSAASSIGFPGLVPMGLGLMRGPASALTAACGMISWFFIKTVNEVAAPLEYSADSSMLDVVQGMLDGLMNNTELLMYIIIFASVVLAVSLIRKSGLNWAWELAIIIGALLQISLYFVLGALFGAEQDLASFIIGTIAAAVISFILAFFVYNVDYRGAEHLQFEDDDFVYYVKAIPKKKSAVPLDEEELYEDEDWAE